MGLKFGPWLKVETGGGIEQTVGQLWLGQSIAADSTNPIMSQN